MIDRLPPETVNGGHTEGEVMAELVDDARRVYLLAAGPTGRARHPQSLTGGKFTGRRALATP